MVQPSSISTSIRQPLPNMDESSKTIVIPFPEHEDSSAFAITSLLSPVTLADNQLNAEKKKTKNLYKLAMSTLTSKIKELCQDQQSLQLANRELQNELSLERIAHQALVENLKKQLDCQQELISKLNQELADSKRKAAERILTINEEKEVAVLTATKATQERVQSAAKTRWRTFLQFLVAKQEKSLAEYDCADGYYNAYPHDVHHKNTWYQRWGETITCRDILIEARNHSGLRFEFSDYKNLTECLERRT